MALLLRTPRLELVPLTAQELDMLVSDLPRLEKRLGVTYRGEPLNGAFGSIVKGQYNIVADDPDNYVWNTFWLIVRREDRVVVGSSDFKAPPDSAGTVEIGYGLGRGFCHNGYMTETVRTMCRFAFSHKNVNRVIAETEIGNLPSIRVLTRCGFREYRMESTMWWYIERELFENAITNQ